MGWFVSSSTSLMLSVLRFLVFLFFHVVHNSISFLFSFFFLYLNVTSYYSVTAFFFPLPLLPGVINLFSPLFSVIFPIVHLFTFFFLLNHICCIFSSISLIIFSLRSFLLTISFHSIFYSKCTTIFSFNPFPLVPSFLFLPL